MFPLVDALVDDLETFVKQVKGQLDAVASHASQLYSRVVGEGTLKKEWLDATRGMKDITKCANKAHTYITKLRESWQHLLRDKAAKSMSLGQPLSVFSRIVNLISDVGKGAFKA